MKLPQSKLESHELEALFQESLIMKQHFFPRKVPSRPNCKSPPKNEMQTSLKNKSYEKQLEKN